MELWALFSEENEYNQPRNNLKKLYKNKPSFEVLIHQFYGETPLSDLEEEDIINVVRVLQGDEMRFSNTDYRLETVEVVE